MFTIVFFIIAFIRFYYFLNESVTHNILLGEFNNRNMTCFYVTKNAAPRSVFSAKLRGNYTQTYINHLFQGSGNFVDEEINKLDVLVVDEAHRLNKKSGLSFNPASRP